MELLKVVTVEEAKRIIDENFTYELGYETINICESTGRILYHDVISNIDVPHFRRSTVDGYAVNSRDIFGASEAIPAILENKGEILMGKVPPSGIKNPGECMYISTGGMLPDGADSVVMIEYTQKLDETTVLVNEPVAPGENVIQVGEDISKGEVCIKKGSKLRPYEIGVLSSLGILDVDVYKRPRIAIISTGDEIVDAGTIPKLAQVRDINTYFLYTSIASDGGNPVNYGVVNDNYNALRSIVNKAVDECDIVIVSGGSSVGKKDQTLNVINSIGSPGVIVHGLSIKPGKPTIIGKAGDKAIFGLPGHPLAAAVIYKILVKYYMDKISSYKHVSFPLLCRFSINYHKAKGREEYLPVILEWKNGEIIAQPVLCKSGIITGFSKARGYVRIDRNLEGLKEGEEVHVYEF